MEQARVGSRSGSATTPTHAQNDTVGRTSITGSPPKSNCSHKPASVTHGRCTRLRPNRYCPRHPGGPPATNPVNPINTRSVWDSARIMPSGPSNSVVIERDAGGDLPAAAAAIGSAGTSVLLDRDAITLERVEHLDADQRVLSPVRGVNLTRIKFRLNGRTSWRIYPSQMLVELLRTGLTTLA